MNLLGNKMILWAVKNRGLFFLIYLANLVVFILVILTGLFGTTNGAHNFAVVFVWIVWWFLLISMMVPFFARLWCGLCPIPVAGEWFQRRALLGVKEMKPPLLRWPDKLKNIWLSTFFFMGVAMFSIIFTTSALATGALMLALIIIAVAAHLLFEKRTFCKYICPVGGFLSLYSMVAPTEIRARTKEICKCHLGKECVKGSPAGYGCPWMNYPGGLDRNNYCGFCFECVKTCPYNNMTLKTRKAMSDLLVPHRKIDEAFKAIIMLNLALLYLFVLLGPNAWLKDWARIGAGIPNYLLYLSLFFGSSLALMPGAFYAVSALSKRLAAKKELTNRKVFTTYAYSLVPLGLGAWVAFSVPIMQVNWAYIVVVLNDPFGWGWNILGAVGNWLGIPYLAGIRETVEWTPFFTLSLPIIQIGLIVAGLYYGVKVTLGLSSEITPDRVRGFRSALPVAAFQTAMAVFFIWNFAG